MSPGPRGLRKVGSLAVEEESSIKASAGDGTIDLEKKQTTLVGENRRSRKFLLNVLWGLAEVKVLILVQLAERQT